MSNIGSDTLLNFITNCDGFIFPECEPPLYVTIDSISQNSADISWTPGYDETSWNLQYREASSTYWGEIIPVTSTNYHISGLSAETEYQVHIQAICIENSATENEYQQPIQAKGNDTLSEWTSPISFTTLRDVGINQIITSQNIILQPNPADSYIDIHINSGVKVKEAIVYNAFGQIIQFVQLTDNQARLDLSNMASGLYFVCVNGDNNNATKKFIKR